VAKKFKREGLEEFIRWMTSGGHEFIVQSARFEHCTTSSDSRCCRQPCWTTFKHICGPICIHPMSLTWWMLPGLPRFIFLFCFVFVFCYSSASMYSIIVNTNQRVKNGVGLGTVKARSGMWLQVVDNLLKWPYNHLVDCKDGQYCKNLIMTC